MKRFQDAPRGRQRAASDDASSSVSVPERLREVLDARAGEIDALSARGEVVLLVVDPSDGWRAALEFQGWRGESLLAMSERTRLSVSTVDEVTERWLAAPRSGISRVFAVIEDDSLLVNRTAEGYAVEPGSTD